MRKVKFTQDSFDEKLGAILTDFPMLDVRAFLKVPGSVIADAAWHRTSTPSCRR
jgi:hypothetical protein